MICSGAYITIAGIDRTAAVDLAKVQVQSELLLKLDTFYWDVYSDGSLLPAGGNKITFGNGTTPEFSCVTVSVEEVAAQHFLS